MRILGEVRERERVELKESGWIYNESRRVGLGFVRVAEQPSYSRYTKKPPGI